MYLTVDKIPLISQAREHVFPPRHCVSAIFVESQSPSTAISPHGGDNDPLQPTQVIEVGFPSCLMMIRPDQPSFDGFDISMAFKLQNKSQSQPLRSHRYPLQCLHRQLLVSKFHHYVC